MPATRSMSRGKLATAGEIYVARPESLVHSGSNSEAPKTSVTPIKNVKTSRYFNFVAPWPVPKPSRPLSADRYGLIQEELQDNLFFLLVQSILWNQTWGKSARPVLDTILTLYPTPEKMAMASLPELTMMIYPIGMHNRRAKRLIDLAQTWLAAPPCKERRYRKVGYPDKQSGKNVKPGEVLNEVGVTHCCITAC
jgi:methyl-CpG-binding domain protein 4